MEGSSGVYFKLDRWQYKQKPKYLCINSSKNKVKTTAGGALINIEGYTVIENVVNNLKPSKYIDEIILAISISLQDDLIENIANRKSILFCRGDEDCVIKRFIDIAGKFNTDIVVRVTYM